MSVLAEISIKIDETTTRHFTLSINDKTKNGRNISIFLPETKEDREKEKDRVFVGGGRVFWTDGNVTVAETENSTK